MINSGKKTNLKGIMREIGERKNFHNLIFLSVRNTVPLLRIHLIFTIGEKVMNRLKRNIMPVQKSLVL